MKCTKSGIYRFISTDGKIIYTGSAKCIDTRLKAHFSPKGSHLPKEVYDQVSIVEIIPFDDYGSALAAEQWSINHYKPKYNKRDKVKNIDVKTSRLDYLDSKWQTYMKLKPLDTEKIEANKKDDIKALVVAATLFVGIMFLFLT